MLANYLPVLIFLVVATGWRPCCLALGAVSADFGPRIPDDPEKLSPYECGFEAFEDTRMKFDVRYYLVAILFIVFDLEIAFLFPWAVALEASARSAWSPWASSCDPGRRLRLRVEERERWSGIRRASRRPKTPAQASRSAAFSPRRSTAWSTGRAPARCGR